jgi:hypothetical protein
LWGRRLWPIRRSALRASGILWGRPACVRGKRLTPNLRRHFFKRDVYVSGSAGINSQSSAVDMSRQRVARRCSANRPTYGIFAHRGAILSGLGLNPIGSGTRERAVPPTRFYSKSQCVGRAPNRCARLMFCGRLMLCGLTLCRQPNEPYLSAPWISRPQRVQSNR